MEPPPLLPPAPPSGRRPPRALSAAAPLPARAPLRRHSRPPRSAAAAAATAASPAPLLLRRLPGNAGSHGAHLPNRPGGKPLPTRTGPPGLLRGQGQGRVTPLGARPGRGRRQGGRLGRRLASGASSCSPGRRSQDGVNGLSPALPRWFPSPTN